MEGKASSLRWTIIGLLCLAVYQGMEVASKLRTLRILHPVKNPEAVSYSECPSSATFIAANSHGSMVS